jgi:hypothetical protein
MEPKIITFEKVDHPKIPTMAYSTGFSGLFWEIIVNVWDDYN